MNLNAYIKLKYLAACNEQWNIETIDTNMILMLKSGNYNQVVVISWMCSYGLFRGINSADRQKVAIAFLDFAKSAPKKLPKLPESLKALFLKLHIKLYKEVERSWISATSKLLWCLYPRQVAIYDSFVWRSLVVLQSLDKEMSRFSKIGSNPILEKIEDIERVAEHYMLFNQLITLLLIRHQAQLKALRAVHKEKYLYDVRILDKILWMIGNANKSF